jgi:hypothetical protein
MYMCLFIFLFSTIDTGALIAVTDPSGTDAPLDVSATDPFIPSTTEQSSSVSNILIIAIVVPIAAVILIAGIILFVYKQKQTSTHHASRVKQRSVDMQMAIA